MADHNDPNAVNTIFSDIDVSAADVYDMFGFPSDAGEDKVVLALTFASVPEAGVFDTDMLYRLRLDRAPARRPARRRDWSLDALLKYAEGVKDKYLDHFSVAEIRVRVDRGGPRRSTSSNFPGGSFSPAVDLNEVVTTRRRAVIRSRSSSAGATTRSSTTCRGSSARSTTRPSSTTCRTRCRSCAS